MTQTSSPDTSITESVIPATPVLNSYVGRFAPSPSGPLHMGSLVAALGSFLDARANKGKWLVRIEDIDPPREQAGASDSILRSLESLGLEWDGEILFQSTRHEAYRAALQDLFEKGALYYCTCSRQQLKEYGPVYPGFCRGRTTERPNSSIRCQVEQANINFKDIYQGDYRQPHDEGDFIVLRKDGLFAYQLAVTVDDYFQNITHIIRGIDLLDSTPRQRHLQSLLNYPQPIYGHLPILIDQTGKKLSKQHYAPALQPEHACQNLAQALVYLNQNPPETLWNEKINTILEWAIKNWQPKKITNKTQINEILPSG